MLTLLNSLKLFKLIWSITFKENLIFSKEHLMMLQMELLKLISMKLKQQSIIRIQRLQMPRHSSKNYKRNTIWHTHSSKKSMLREKPLRMRLELERLPTKEMKSIKVSILILPGSHQSLLLSQGVLIISLSRQTRGSKSVEQQFLKTHLYWKIPSKDLKIIHSMDTPLTRCITQAKKVT